MIAIDFYRLTSPGQTGNRKNMGEQNSKATRKRLETLFTHRCVFNIYLHELPFTCILDCTDNKTPKVVPVGCIGLWKHRCVLSEFGKIKEIEKI